MPFPPPARRSSPGSPPSQTLLCTSQRRIRSWSEKPHPSGTRTQTPWFGGRHPLRPFLKKPSSSHFSKTIWDTHFRVDVPHQDPGIKGKFLFRILKRYKNSFVIPGPPLCHQCRRGRPHPAAAAGHEANPAFHVDRDSFTDCAGHVLVLSISCAHVHMRHAGWSWRRWSYDSEKCEMQLWADLRYTVIALFLMYGNSYRPFPFLQFPRPFSRCRLCKRKWFS